LFFKPAGFPNEFTEWLWNSYGIVSVGNDLSSSGELSLILLPLAGQSALLLPLAWMIPVCVLIYLTLVMPLILRSRWVDAIALAVIYGTGIVFVRLISGCENTLRRSKS
jgi:hypothetical protein